MPAKKTFDSRMPGSRAGTRREYLAHGAVGAAAALASASASAQHQHEGGSPSTHAGHGAHVPERFDRYRPGSGGPPGSDDYLGKLVPGLREPGLAPVPITGPDLVTKAPRIVDGVKEWDLSAEPVTQEFLPNRFMQPWGYDGRMPGPTLEAVQGDRVRFIVKNNLPEETSLHFHGIEMPVMHDGVAYLQQNPIQPGATHVYEFDLHQVGTFFYHSHYAMQETMGMVGFFLVHPKIGYEPTVDRDFALCFQNFFIPPNSTIPDTLQMDWNWHTINGRSGPYTTPLVCKHGERLRIRLLNFSPMQHHPIHLHGHTFWVTGTEGGRVPESAWIPENNTVTGVAKAKEIEFVANNIGDWPLHCHMTHHMMNHMVSQVGPKMRPGESADDYIRSLDMPPERQPARDEPPFNVPGYPQDLMQMYDAPDFMRKILGRREVRGMRQGWNMGVMGLMTTLRVLPEDVYELVMHSDAPVDAGISVPGASPPGMHMHMHQHG